MCIANEFFNIAMKKCLSSSGGIFLIFSEWVVSIKIMKVSIHIAIAASCIAICPPSFAESALAVPRDACQEISCSSLQSREFCFKFIGKSSSIPSGESGVEITKLTKNNASKLNGSVAIRNVSLNSKKAKDSEECNQYCYFQYLFPVLIIAIGSLFIDQKANV